MDKPVPLVPRELRFGIPERLDGRGNVLIKLDETSVRGLAPVLQGCGVEAVAIGYMHAYLDARRKRRTPEILAGISARDPLHAIERGLTPDPRI